MGMARRKFRFEDLEIWQETMAVTDLLLDIADELEAKKLFRFAKQLRGASLSIINNIAEGAGSISVKEFTQFLNFSRRSIFENANMLFLFEHRRLISSEQKEKSLSGWTSFPAKSPPSNAASKPKINPYPSALCSLPLAILRLSFAPQSRNNIVRAKKARKRKGDDKYESNVSDLDSVGRWSIYSGINCTVE